MDFLSQLNKVSTQVKGKQRPEGDSMTTRRVWTPKNLVAASVRADPVRERVKFGGGRAAVPLEEKED